MAVTATLTCAAILVSGQRCSTPVANPGERCDEHRFDRELDLVCSRTEIAERVRRLGSEIAQEYRHKPLGVIVLLDGAAVFAADLVRELEGLDVRVGFMKISTYRGRYKLRSDPKVIPMYRSTDMANRQLLVVDDIYDTGETMRVACAYLTGYVHTRWRPSPVVLLSRKRFDVSIGWVGCYCGFDVSNDKRWFVGYGMDFDGNYRNMPDLWALRGSDERETV